MVRAGEIYQLVALVPDGCTVLMNERGTAAGMWFERDGRVLVVERGGLAEIDPDTASVTARHAIPEGRFLNDITVGPERARRMAAAATAAAPRAGPPAARESAMGIRKRACRSFSRMSGKSPPMVLREVRVMARNRRTPPLRMASK